MTMHRLQVSSLVALIVFCLIGIVFLTRTYIHGEYHRGYLDGYTNGSRDTFQRINERWINTAQDAEWITKQRAKECRDKLAEVMKDYPTTATPEGK